MFEALFHFITSLISSWGTTGIFILMMLESMIAPIPSEGVMPFAGFLIYQGNMTWMTVILVSSAGSMIGSFLSYLMGYIGGKPIVLTVGRYFMLNKKHLETTERFFKNHGGLTVFISRFIPIIRHFISLPAGMGKMALLPFLVLTLLGATLWNAFLTYCGFKLGEHWDTIHHYTHYLDILVICLILGYIGLTIWKRRLARNAGINR